MEYWTRVQNFNWIGWKTNVMYNKPAALCKFSTKLEHTFRTTCLLFLGVQTLFQELGAGQILKCRFYNIHNCCWQVVVVCTCLVYPQPRLSDYFVIKTDWIREGNLQIVLSTPTYWIPNFSKTTQHRIIIQTVSETRMILLSIMSNHM